MAKAIDLSTVSPERAARLLAERAQKKRAYQRRKAEFDARSAAWRAANPEKCAAIEKAWREANPERKAATTKDYYERNRDDVLARQANRQRELNDAVVKSLYCRDTGLQSKDIPQELVPLIRTTIQVKRAIKEQKRELRRTDR